MNEQSTAVAQPLTEDSYAQGVRKLIERTLQNLSTLQSSSRPASVVRQTIFSNAVRFCRKRVAHYRCYAIKFAGIINAETVRSEEGEFGSGYSGKNCAHLTKVQQLLIQITELCSTDKDDLTVCRDAHDFCRSDAGLQLRSGQACTSSAWPYLRHNIGKLGCWYKAARYLVNYAQNYADVLADFTVNIVPRRTPHPESVPFRGTLVDLFPKTNVYGYDFSLHRMHAVFGGSAMEQAETDLDTFNRSPRWLKLHAEVCLVDFFHETERAYWDNTPYIGCSKGACYCCDIYFFIHPGEPIRRPCHGNAWVKWQCSGMVSSRTVEPTLLTRMIMRMRDDVNRTIMSEGQQGHARTFDSSTGVVSFGRTSDIRGLHV